MHGGNIHGSERRTTGKAQRLWVQRKKYCVYIFYGIVFCCSHRSSSGPDADDGHDGHAEGHAREAKDGAEEAFRAVELLVVDEPVHPDDAHSHEEQKAPAQGVQDTDGDVGTLDWKGPSAYSFEVRMRQPQC